MYKVSVALYIVGSQKVEEISIMNSYYFLGETFVLILPSLHLMVTLVFPFEHAVNYMAKQYENIYLVLHLYHP